MKQYISFSKILIDRAREFPDRTVYSFLEDGSNISSQLTFSELDLAARSAAVTLSRHAKPGSRAIVVYPPGLEFVIALFGCFYSGIIPVPVRCHKKTLAGIGFDNILDQTEPACIVGRSEVFDRGWLGTRKKTEISHQQLIAGIADQFSLNHQTQNDIALLQYTSGSTSSPRGVMISHGNLLHNSRNIREAFGLGPQTVSVSWLPHYHDMGLVDGILQPVFSGYSAYLFPATAFLNRPITWLQTISRFRADHSGGPDFAYSHCVNNVNATQCEELDLSCWRSAYNGSEPIRHKTIEDFVNKFGSYGFKKHYFFPCYGLAESTLMVSGGKIEEEPKYVHVDRDALSRNLIVQCTPGRTGSISLVSSGQAGSTYRLAIVNADTSRQLGEGQVGEIWLAGKSVASGYWQNESDSQQVFNALILPGAKGPFLRTGDLGFICDSSLYVTGRIKDMIIIRGVNYYAPDLEENVRNCHPQVAGTNVAAFPLQLSDKENIAIAIEVNRQFVNSCNVHEIAQRVRRIVAEQFETEVYLVLLLKPQGLPVTTSGKIKRYLCQQLFLSGNPNVLYSSCLYQDGTTVPPPQPPDLLKWTNLNPAEKETQIKEYLLSSLRSITGQVLSENDLEGSLAAIGLDSLQTTALVHQMNRDWNSSLTTHGLAEVDKIKQLIPMLCQHAGVKQDAFNLEELYLDPDRSLPSSPASVGQAAQWFLNKLHIGNPVYNLSIVLHLSGELKARYLDCAVEVVLKRHNALRTVFSVSDMELLQITLPCWPIVIDWKDALQPNDQLTNEAISQEASQPFDLQTGPLFRIVVWKVHPHEHILQLVAHHSVVDLYSAEIILKEIWTLYGSYSRRQEPKLETVKAHNADFSRWQQTYLQGQQAKASLDYWLGQLTGVRPLRFPTYSGRMFSNRFAGDTFTCTIDAFQSKAIREFAARAGVTPYVTLLAVYQVLLHRYCRAADFIVGSSVSYRNRRQFENTVGYLANQIALRARLEGDPEFNQFLQAVKTTVADGIAHGDYPFAHLVKHLAKGADRSEPSLLIQTMFNFESITLNAGIKALATAVRGATLNIDHLTISSIPYISQGAQFDMRLSCIEHNAGLTCAWEYRTELFDLAMITMIHGYFVNLIKAALRNPHLRVSRLSLLDDADRSMGLNQNNRATRQQSIESECFSFMFEERVRKSADAVAIKASSIQLTYGELNERANQLSRYLNELGIGMEDVIGIFLHRSPEMLIAMLAIWKAGAVCLPLDPDLPPMRLTYMADNAGCKLIICQGLNNRNPSFNCSSLDLDFEQISIARQVTENLPHKGRGDALAYVLYTSGSTGMPKGVMIEHRGLANYLTWCAAKYDLSKGEGAVVSSSFAFDATLTTLLGPLVCGASVILIPETGEIEALIQLMHLGRDISAVKLTPSKLRLIESILRQQALGPLFSVRAFIVGGEPLTGRDLIFWRDYSPRLRIINEYGPTETVVGSTTYEVDDRTPLDSAIPIGTPIFNTQIYVLDDNLQPVPPMVEGELYIGGTGVARGYINSPQQTHERFLPNPFSPDERLFRTGDLAKYNHDETLLYCGRRDDQVKISGARVELAEVEIAIRHFNFVAETVVAVRNLNDLQDALVAYIRPNGNGHQLNYLAIRNGLLDRLPSYMVPTHFFVLTAFPISSSGKIDRQALAKLPLSYGIRIPQGPMIDESLERQLTDAWSEVLGKPVERHENFFDLGGDSLLAGVLQSKLSDMLGVQISITDLFRYPTVALLALRVRGVATDSATHDDIQTRVSRRKQVLNMLDKNK